MPNAYIRRARLDQNLFQFHFDHVAITTLNKAFFFLARFMLISVDGACHNFSSSFLITCMDTELNSIFLHFEIVNPINFENCFHVHLLHVQNTPFLSQFLLFFSWKYSPSGSAIMDLSHRSL